VVARPELGELSTIDVEVSHGCVRPVEFPKRNDGRDVADLGLEPRLRCVEGHETERGDSRRAYPWKNDDLMTDPHDLHFDLLGLR